MITSVLDYPDRRNATSFSEAGREFLVRRADRLMFGTDFLSPGQNVPQFALFEELNLPQEVEPKIFRENARRALQL